MSTVSYRDFTGSAAEGYERWFVPAIATPVSVGLLEAARLQPGERVLDVACGTGVIARAAAPQVGRTGTVTGLDLAPDMVEVARTLPSPPGPDIDWRVGDAAALPFPTGSFDVVLCQMGLMFMTDRPAAVAEMRRVLARGGRVVVTTPGRIQRPFELLERALVDHIGPQLGGFVRAVFSMPDPEAVGELLRGAGLLEVSSTESTATFLLPPTAEFLWQYVNLTPMGPIVARAPAAARDALERQVVEGWQPFVVDGTTPIDQPMVIATGRA